MAVQNTDPFYKRIFQYQKERFPVLGHGVLISAFTFSAVSYSRICRGAEGFIPIKDFLIGIWATITLFMLVRIFDEFKDKEDDAKYRSYLPVPRGLVSLKELQNIAWIIAIAQVIGIAFLQSEMLLLYAVVLGYLMLMRVEFFIPEWLKNHHLIYIGSHMVIIPLIDIYSSGLDWLLSGASFHIGLFWFFGVSFCNGLVLEFGRKLRTPATEEEGVLSYTKFFGQKRGTLVWIGTLMLTALIAIGASHFAGYGNAIVWPILIIVICSSIPGWIFLKQPTAKLSKVIEYVSAAWTILMYLALGGIPMISKLVS